MSKKQLFNLFLNRSSCITFEYKPENSTFKAIKDCPYIHEFDNIQENTVENIDKLNHENFNDIEEVVNIINTLNIPNKHKNSIVNKLDAIISKYIHNYKFFIQKAKETIDEFLNYKENK